MSHPFWMPFPVWERVLRTEGGSKVAASAPASPGAEAVLVKTPIDFWCWSAVFLRILKPVENCRVALAGAAFHPVQI